MSKKSLAKLVVANPKETRLDWSSVFTGGLSSLAEWISRTFAVDTSTILSDQEVVAQDEAPEGEMKGSLWVKTSSPPAIGIYYNGEYRLFYEYPPNSPVLIVGDPPSYMREVSETQLDQFNIEAPDENSGAKYYIFEPSLV